jgi:hypothetical protein
MRLDEKEKKTTTARIHSHRLHQDSSLKYFQILVPPMIKFELFMLLGHCEISNN